MLVLTRKLDEQIMIGEDIKVTLFRVKGNTVRIGIEAPKDVRIVRGELGPLDEAKDDQDGALTDRELAFAHPQPALDANAKRAQNRNAQTQIKQPNQVKTLNASAQSGRTKPRPASTAPLPSRLPLSVSRITADSDGEVFVGTVQASGEQPKLSRAPLAHFVSAS